LPDTNALNGTARITFRITARITARITFLVTSRIARVPESR